MVDPIGYRPPPPGQRITGNPQPTPQQPGVEQRGFSENAAAVPDGYHRVTLGEMAKILNRASNRENLRGVTRGALDHCALIIEKEAKRVIGTYEYGWPRLQPETIARKAGDTPLLETGEMRDSIEHSVDDNGEEAYVGSNNPKAVWQELGTRTIPARSFLMGAAMHMESQVHAIMGRSVYMGLFSYGAQLLDITGMVERAAEEQTKK
jgi:hypothetical protein